MQLKTEPITSGALYCTSQAKRDAGISCQEKNSPKEHELSVHKDNARSYARKDETDRDIKRNEVLIKDFQFYNRKDSLWNDTAKL